jgi:hypothetical protein
VKVTGEDAEKFLDWILVNSIAGLSVGRGKYTTMLDENGGIIDDLVAFHKDTSTWWLSTLYGPHMVRWFDAHKGDYDVAYRDITQGWDMYAVQGPNSAHVMNDLVANPVDELKRFQLLETQAAGVPVVVDRGGFTGELGYEVYCTREDSPAIAAAIDEAASKVTRQLRKYKTRIIDKRQRSKRPEPVLEPMPNVAAPESEPEDEDDELVREKFVELTPMSIDEALVQIDLIGHDFYVFEDSRSGLTNVVYRRKDGGYGIIRPKIEDEDEQA